MGGLYSHLRLGWNEVERGGGGSDRAVFINYIIYYSFESLSSYLGLGWVDRPGKGRHVLLYVYPPLANFVNK